MRQVTLNMTDTAYNHLIYIIENIPSIDIIKDIKKINLKNNNFKIDTKECLNTLEEIKNNKVDKFKAVKPNNLFEELGF